MADKKLLVIGCGVSGLSSGILLLKAGYNVRIWAKELPPNTTSDIAAAFWYPYLCNPKDKVTRWSGYTLKYLQDNCLDDPEAGCIERTVTEIFDRQVGEPWWKDAVESYRRPSAAELPEGYVDAYQIGSILMDSSKYMPYLFKTFTDLGGTYEQREVRDIHEAFEQSDIVINCSGLGSRKLFDDKTVYPVRGQVIVAKPNGYEAVTADDDAFNNLSYIIPRINDIIIGGTAQKGNWSLDVDPKDTEEILRKSRHMSPLFDEVEIVDQKVGLRPARDEVRLETEDFGKGKYVVHNYGHGGAGYTLSWGCANDVVGEVERIK